MLTAAQCKGGKRALINTTTKIEFESSSQHKRRPSKRGIDGNDGAALAKRPVVAHRNGNETATSGSLFEVANKQPKMVEDIVQGYARINAMLLESLSAQFNRLNKVQRFQEEMIRKITEESVANQEDINKVLEQIRKLTPMAPVNLNLNFSTLMPSISSSQMGNLTVAESSPKQPRVKIEHCGTLPAVNKPPESCPLKYGRTKKSSTQNKSCKGNIGEIRDLSLVTVDKPYYTCLKNLDAARDDSIPEVKNSMLEVPSWRIKQFHEQYSLKGIENMSDEIYKKKHSNLELNERKQKRWEMQRLRELKRIEHLKAGRNKKPSQIVKKEELTTLLPNPTKMKSIDITNKIPIMAFGTNIYDKKKYSRLSNRYCIKIEIGNFSSSDRKSWSECYNNA